MARIVERLLPGRRAPFCLVLLFRTVDHAHLGMSVDGLRQELLDMQVIHFEMAPGRVHRVLTGETIQHQIFHCLGLQRHALLAQGPPYSYTRIVPKAKAPSGNRPFSFFIGESREMRMRGEKASSRTLALANQMYPDATETWVLDKWANFFIRGGH